MVLEEHMLFREGNVLDLPFQHVHSSIVRPRLQYVTTVLELFPHARMYRFSPLLSHIPLDVYNWPCVSVPCDYHVVECEEDDDGAKDYNRPASRRA